MGAGPPPPRYAREPLSAKVLSPPRRTGRSAQRISQRQDRLVHGHADERESALFLAWSCPRSSPARFATSTSAHARLNCSTAPRLVCALGHGCAGDRAGVVGGEPERGSLEYRGEGGDGELAVGEPAAQRVEDGGEEQFDVADVGRVGSVEHG